MVVKWNKKTKTNRIYSKSMKYMICRTPLKWRASRAEEYTVQISLRLGDWEERHPTIAACKEAAQRYEDSRTRHVEFAPPGSKLVGTVWNGGK